MEDIPVREEIRSFSGDADARAEWASSLIDSPRAGEIIDFLDSPVAANLIATGRLVPTEVLRFDEEGLHLRQPAATFTSYPWEWPGSLWMAAADLTLNLCSQLLTEGWLLRDATPRNVQFDGPYPRLVNVQAMERISPVRPLWLAYDQFVRTFLLPVLAHSQLGWPLQATQMCPDGFEPEEVYATLSRLGRLRRMALNAVTWPVLLSRMMGSRLAVKDDPDSLPPRHAGDIQAATAVIRKRLDDLRAAMAKAMPLRRSSLWLEYAGTFNVDSQADPVEKRSFLTAALERCAPKRMLDARCGSGFYSRLAAGSGAEVIALDTDTRALDRLYAAVRYTEMKVIPLCVDLAYPTAAHGWENAETASFLSRCDGRFDTVLMLGVLPRLLLGSHASLDRVSRLCHRITTHNLIAEWIPPSDPDFVEARRGREAEVHLDEDLFRRSFAAHFDIAGEAALPNGRVLFHMTKRDAAKQH